MIKRFPFRASRASLSSVKAASAEKAPKPKSFRVFFVGYLAMWFVVGIVLELAGYSLRERRKVALSERQISECVTLSQWLSFTHAGMPIC